ncbi:efflux RND transporter periplasmic adaptor subunit [Desulfoferrobacter suflitae]|uniref:efflux RND transporter periplasmic adaptor subunit n=1 Tax=Desulfoferrobacter suflitae TaxID=2865782 RepID=UPI00216406C4|nr:efflux RND transporter periplasmic adaptor subunit [Desulfoferrobacter suflitae]MCK8601541.1 efflux RND transporter periplasmic adaptor subunit [Desulfoferrobacter suflitae]
MAKGQVGRDARAGFLLRGTVQMSLLAAAAWLGIVACNGDRNQYIPPPPPQVTVTRPVTQAITDYVELTGNLQAYATVDLVARIEGFLSSIEFQDGDFVDQGKLLFVIEPQPYEARLALALANVDQQKALLLRAEQEYARQLRLIKENATAQSEVEKWRAERDAAKAALNQALANADIAKINLGYTRVNAPFRGRMERHLVDLGNLVGAGQATKLATIVRLDPIYAYFNLSELELVRLLARDREDNSRRATDKTIPVYLQIAGEQDYSHQGRLDFASATVNATTGTLLLRAIFENPVVGNTPVLLPGMFAQIRIPVSVNENALLVPDSALGLNQGRHYLLIVNDKNVVEQRPVEIGSLMDDMRVIRDGLQSDDWVVVEGIQRARPDATVTPVKKAPR